MVFFYVDLLGEVHATILDDIVDYRREIEHSFCELRRTIKRYSSGIVRQAAFNAVGSSIFGAEHSDRSTRCWCVPGACNEFVPRGSLCIAAMMQTRPASPDGTGARLAILCLRQGSHHWLASERQAVLPCMRLLAALMCRIRRRTDR